MLSKLVLHRLRFATLASFGRFILALPSLKILDCFRVEAASRGNERFLQVLMSHSSGISDLHVSPRPAPHWRTALTHSC